MVIRRIVKSSDYNSLSINGSIVSFEDYFATLNLKELSPESLAIILAAGDYDLINSALSYDDSRKHSRVYYVREIIKASMNSAQENSINVDVAQMVYNAEFLITIYSLRPLLFSQIFNPSSFESLVSSIENYDYKHFSKLSPLHKSIFYDMSMLMGLNKLYLSHLLYVDNKVARLLLKYSYESIDRLYEILYDESYKNEYGVHSIREKKFFLVAEFPETFAKLQKHLVLELSDDINNSSLKELFVGQDGVEVINLLKDIAISHDSKIHSFICRLLPSKKKYNYAMVLLDLIERLKKIYKK
jgi:hypothetical protein